MKKRKLSDLKCPKCGKQPDDLQENAEAMLCYHLEDGKYIDMGWLPGNITGMSAYCSDCEYQWTLRGILQITDFEDYDEGYNEVNKNDNR
jgi:hypothetical protein